MLDRKRLRGANASRKGETMTTRRNVLLGGLSAALSACATAPATGRPNLLLILADDLGFSDLGCFGSEIATPNIDRLAAEGMRLSNFHTTATCSPTRAMLLTGQDNHEVGYGNMLEIMADNQFGQPGYEGYLNDRAVTFVTRLRDAGYDTMMAGKWHLGLRPESQPRAQGFRRSVSMMHSGADNYEAKPYLEQNREAIWLEDGERIALPEDFYSSHYYAARLIEFLGERPEQPFFAYLPFQAVHYPHQAPAELIERYLPLFAQGYDALRETRYQRLVQLGLMPGGGAMLRAPIIPRWESLSSERQRRRTRQMAVYAAMVEAMDNAVARVIDSLRADGRLDDTLVIFMSDNGADSVELDLLSPAYYARNFNLETDQLGLPGSYSSYGPGWASASMGPLRAFKGAAYEGGMRVPFIARWPGRIAPGSHSNAFSFLSDVAPTLLRTAGVAGAQGLRGGDMTGLLTGAAERIHDPDAVICYELAGSAAVFRGDLKLTRNIPPFDDRSWRLYNLAADPGETNDLAAQHPDIVAELTGAFEAYAAEVGVVHPPPDYSPLTQLQRNVARFAAQGGHDH
jgi:arylsulfatase A-like enzyme